MQTGLHEKVMPVFRTMLLSFCKKFPVLLCFESVIMPPWQIFCSLWRWQRWMVNFEWLVMSVCCLWLTYTRLWKTSSGDWRKNTFVNLSESVTKSETHSIWRATTSDSLSTGPLEKISPPVSIDVISKGIFKNVGFDWLTRSLWQSLDQVTVTTSWSWKMSKINIFHFP